MVRTLRLFPNHEIAREALHTRVPPGARVLETQMKWVLEHGNEVWFRTVDAELRGIEWTYIIYDEAGELDGQTVARLESYKRLPTGDSER